MTIFRHPVALLTALLLVASGCAEPGDTDDPTTGSDDETGSILSDSINDTSGGGAGLACSVAVFPNPIGLPSDVLDVNGTSFSMTNIATDHPLITNNGDGHHDDTVFTTDILVPNPGDTDSYLYFIDWTVQTLSVNTCRPTEASLVSRARVRFPDGGVTSEDRHEDFEGFLAGTMVTNQYDGFVVDCSNAKDGHPDTCILFDSANPTGNDEDLRSDEAGMILIIAENLRDDDGDGLVDDPDDEARGGAIEITFDQPATVQGISLLDIDTNEQAAAIKFIKADGSTSSVDIPAAGDNVAVTVDIDESDVVSMTVSLPRSGAITDLYYAFETEVPGDGPGTAIMRAVWDATDGSGATVPDGGYIFNMSATLVREDGLVVESLSSEFMGMLVDSRVQDFDQQPYLNVCDDGADPDGCECAAGEGDCTTVGVSSLGTWADVPTAIAPFITTTIDPISGRYHVVVDLTEFNGAGLIPQGSGVWANSAALQAYISSLTGVPAADDERLFNFDFTQIGISTGITPTAFAGENFNNVLLDLITDKDGLIQVNGFTTDLRQAFETGTGPALPGHYEIAGSRVGEECTLSGGFNGSQSMTAKYCVYTEGVVLDPTTDLGIYTFRSSTFDPNVNDAGVTRDLSCGGGGCNVRTREVSAVLTVDSIFYAQSGGVASEVFMDRVSFTGPALSRLVDRGPLGAVLSGECSRSVAENGDIRIRMDSADGAVGENCVINGIFN